MKELMQRKLMLSDIITTSQFNNIKFLNERGMY
mgnify:CR=1 FL=1